MLHCLPIDKPKPYVSEWVLEYVIMLLCSGFVSVALCLIFSDPQTCRQDAFTANHLDIPPRIKTPCSHWGLHAYGWSFCRKRSWSPVLGAKPVMLSVRLMWLSETIWQGAFVKPKTQDPLYVWRKTLEPKGCQSSVSGCLLQELMGHIVRSQCVRVQ